MMLLRCIVLFIATIVLSSAQPAFPPGIDAIMELLRDKQRAAAQPDPEVEAASMVALKTVAAADLEKALVREAVGDDLAQVTRSRGSRGPSQVLWVSPA